MIAALAGVLQEKAPERVVVDVAGVGYLVHVSMQTFTDLPAVGAAVRLLVQTEVREDAIELFGFLTAGERALFHLLRKAKGLGPRLTLAVLSGMPADELVRVMATGDVARLQSIPGVGRKLAERIVLECRDGAVLLGSTFEAAAGLPRLALGNVSDEAVSALVNLGYKQPEAEHAVRRVQRPGASVEDIIRAALQGLAG